eukprot:10012038-Heterocapsa_arctica.AAC.1
MFRNMYMITNSTTKKKNKVKKEEGGPEAEGVQQHISHRPSYRAPLSSPATQSDRRQAGLPDSRPGVLFSPG